MMIWWCVSKSEYTDSASVGEMPLLLMQMWTPPAPEWYYPGYGTNDDRMAVKVTTNETTSQENDEWSRDQAPVFSRDVHLHEFAQTGNWEWEGGSSPVTLQPFFQLLIFW